MKPMTHVTDSNFDQEVLNSPIPVLVDFWAPWCGPCKAIGPHVEVLAAEFEGRAKVVKCNIDESPKTATAYRIQSIPTLLIFKSGAVVTSRIGAPASNVKGVIQAMIMGAL